MAVQAAARTVGCVGAASVVMQVEMREAVTVTAAVKVAAALEPDWAEAAVAKVAATVAVVRVAVRAAVVRAAARAAGARVRGS